MPLLSEQSYSAPQLLLVFTLQVNLSEQEPYTIWAICGNATITDPTEALIHLLQNIQYRCTKDRSHHTHISSSFQATFTSKKVVLPIRLGRRYANMNLITLNFLQWGGMKTQPWSSCFSAKLLLNPYQNPNNQYGSKWKIREVKGQRFFGSRDYSNGEWN